MRDGSGTVKVAFPHFARAGEDYGGCQGMNVNFT